MSRILQTLLAGALFLAALPVAANDPVPDWKSIEPMLKAKCYSCHGEEDVKGEVDLKILASDPKMEEEFELWHRVLDTIENGEMPPRKSEPLAEAEEKAIVSWVNHSLDVLASTNSGDPAVVRIVA